LKNPDFKLKALQKVLESETFKDRDIYKKLLQFIVDASVSGTAPKEVIIAHDVFEKGKEFNAAEDTTVRVHMHNLRKMLEQYYQTEGQSDEIQLCIPKGHYLVKYIEGKKTENKLVKNKNRTIINLLLVFLLTAIGYIIIDIIYQSNEIEIPHAVDKNDAIWGHFFNNNYPTSLVIGDFLVFHEFNNKLNRPRRIQDYEINNIDQLDNYINNNPNKNIENWPLGELPHNSIYNIADLQPVLLSFMKIFEINFTTEIDINFIKNRNIIYVGEFKNLRPLSDLTSKLPVKYKTLPWWHGIISYPVNDSIVTLKTSHDWAVNRYVVDLGVVAKLPGQNDENYLFFVGFGYNSQIKIVHLFSRNSTLNNLYQQIISINGYIPDYFTMVFEVTGFDRASTNAELKFFQEIKEDYYHNYY
jgi:hypothetical protein